MIVSPSMIARTGAIAAARRPRTGPTDPFWLQTRFLLNGTLEDATGRHTLVKIDGTDAVINGDGINLDGLTSYEVLGNLQDFRPAGAYTIEVAFKGPQGVTSSALDAARIILSCYTGGDAGAWELFGRGVNGGYAGGFYSDAVYIEPGGSQWVTSTEHHAAVVYDPVANKTYLLLDGARIGEATGGSNPTETPSRMFLSRENAASAKYWLGSIKGACVTEAVRYPDTTYEVPTWPRPTA